jgi:hypothetical protein
MSPTKGSPADQELYAIGTILSALESLEGASIQRVLDYVFSRLSIPGPPYSKSYPTSVTSKPPTNSDIGHSHLKIPSIRDLKEEKQPESSNQMAALVAYYLSEVLAGDVRKEAINTADLEKYFKQAGFKLPKNLSMTLTNATAAGYFDSVGSGLYRLNPVGYNLIVHGLPRPHSKSIELARGKKAKKRRP